MGRTDEKPKRLFRLFYILKRMIKNPFNSLRLQSLFYVLVMY